MKRILTLCYVVVVLYGHLHAQTTQPVPIPQPEIKQLLFGGLPEEFDCRPEAIQQLVSAEIGEEIFAQLSDQFKVQGKIISKQQNVPGTITVNVRLLNYQNALFNISLRLSADNSNIVKGRVIHPRAADALILTQEKGHYRIRKITQRLFMTD